jgi:polyketide biosynthesis enoyl-CoA hydratase PksH
MTYQTLLVREINHAIEATINRVEQRNALNSMLMQELHQVLDQAEKNPDCHMVIFKGKEGLFCTGMDFQEITQTVQHSEEAETYSTLYMSLLKRFASSSKIIISEIDGQVMAGGVGLAAASDIVIATTRSHFSLSEALWGLLPANVLPYLIRRVGFQKSYIMTLTTQPISATEAHAIHLVDELSDQPEEILRKLSLRLFRIDEKTVQTLKNFFRKLWIINEAMEQTAMHELAKLMQDTSVQKNIKDFVEQKKFPWE